LRLATTKHRNLGQRVVVAIADTVDGGLDARLGSTVHRATSWFSPRNCRQTLRTAGYSIGNLEPRRPRGSFLLLPRRYTPPCCICVLYQPAGFIESCLPIKADALPSGGLWLHEIKHDGFRVVARKNGAQVRL
jgi:hypothetical protein